MQTHKTARILPLPVPDCQIRQAVLNFQRLPIVWRIQYSQPDERQREVAHERPK
jgi:hypothetical protein